MTAKAIMVMGTGSDVGKSLIVAGLARSFARKGLKVAPFKPQNMSNNAAVAAGGEIGRAQALQARAARIAPTVDMNPILLKPESELGAQVIVQGKRVATLKAREFFATRQNYMPAILDSFARLAAQHDLIICEGAGSPAETNLREGDLANFGFASTAQVPALLVGDIHRGGVIASIVGTHVLLSETDRNLLKGFLINKFHGDPQLFDEGLRIIETRTGMPCLGIVPHFARAGDLPAEDAVALDHRTVLGGAGGLHVAVLRLPRIANFDDLDPLRLEPDVTVTFVQPGEAIPASAGLVILPGSKSTLADLAALRHNGWDIDIAAHVRRGGHVLGLCGGYQMLGRMIHDPQGLEGPPSSAAGLGHLDVETALLPDKTVRETDGKHLATGTRLRAYEIHLGKTTGPDTARPFAETRRGLDGAMSRNGKVMGTYLHGCFASDAFRRAFLHNLGVRAADLAYEDHVEMTLDALADHLEAHVNTAAILELAAVPRLST
jgi:adenosylcobyric acid synthase